MTYVFDGFPGHTKAADFAKFTQDKIRCPADFVVQCQVASDSNALQTRFRKKLEVEAELSEEQVEQYRVMMQEYHENVEPYISIFCEHSIELGRTRLILLDTTASSEEAVAAVLRDAVCPKVILVNHEILLPVDAICANLAIKFNMMYISVFQLIKKEIEANTEFGKRLAATKKSKPLSSGEYAGKDE